jgi:1-deoxy-D-xylulose-5-phosphate reductoisomerase
MKKNLSVLGSSGSIGCSTLEVAKHLGFPVVAIAAKSRIDLLEIQAKEFKPSLIAVFDEEKAEELKKRLPSFKIVSGQEGLCEVASFEKTDMVVSALSGAIGIVPTVAGILAGKDIALANKEVLVSAGEYVMKLVRERQVRLVPIDSEHSALFQCLEGKDPKTVRKLIITASGGPFLRHSVEKLKEVTFEEALLHPTWRMGVKITIDSSTLMNKGLEVIEASRLYGICEDRIEIVIHPQSLVHSMVEFVDGSILAQFSITDMKLPIQYALTYPDRHRSLVPFFDFSKESRFDFFPVDQTKFACVPLAYDALRKGKSAPCFMNAANEVLVSRFENKEIGWLDIHAILSDLMKRHELREMERIEEILEVDQIARQEAYKGYP